MAQFTQTSITRFFGVHCPIYQDCKDISHPSGEVGGSEQCRPSPTKTDDQFTKDSGEMTFPFPFPPYDIQKSFMREVYRVLEERKVGIFESPTGTGKSLSLICGALTWLTRFEIGRRKDLEKAIEDSEKIVQSNDKENAPDLDWVKSFHEKKKQTNHLMDLKEEYDKLKAVDQKVKDLRKRRGNQNVRAPPNIKCKADEELDDLLKEVRGVQAAVRREELDDDDGDQEFIVTDYVSEDEEKEGDEDKDDVISETQITKVVCPGRVYREHGLLKIFYCSRTHSQLSQFIGEVQRSPFRDDVRVVALGSRLSSCVNDAVTRFKSLGVINDRCIELQKKKSGKGTKLSINGEVMKKKKCSNGCPYYRQNGIELLRDDILTEIQDIEDLAKKARKLKACPYYASRHAVPLAQLVVLPYNTLLHQSTRQACGINLKDNIVIIDEAHNLLDAISSMHSSEITGAQLLGALSQLSQYKEKYKCRLKAKNHLYISQIIFILQAFLKYLKGSLEEFKANCEKPESSAMVVSLTEFILKTETDNLNLFKILNYCRKSEIARKLMGFSENCQTSGQTDNLTSNVKSSVSLFLRKLSGSSPILQSGIAVPEEDKPVGSSSFMPIEGFLRCLTNMNKNGRIVINRLGTIEHSLLKYYLLNPASHFQDIASEARAVIVAGGTMQPIEEFADQLFLAAGVPKNRIAHFSCGHVIPDSHLLALTLGEGPSGISLDFAYQNRSSANLIKELGRIIVNVSNVVPGGIVCFFPSYEYETQVVAEWAKSNLYEEIEKKKKVFREPRNSSQTNEVLGEFTKCILRNKPNGSSKVTGAILFSVVGGKMSEGINFSDDLGRCVIMVGMPYPNINSPELKEKMDYLNATVPKGNNGKQAGQMYYENLCMKAVNQSIGRAIRHREDYATILLLDSRYTRPSVQSALPGWIRDRSRTYPKFHQAFAAVRTVRTHK